MPAAFLSDFFQKSWTEAFHPAGLKMSFQTFDSHCPINSLDNSYHTMPSLKCKDTISIKLNLKLLSHSCSAECS